MLFNKLISIMTVICLVITIVITENIHAVPASPRIHTLTQADGTAFLARQEGDEWGSIWQTINKYTIIFDKTTQNWMYAIYDVKGKLISSKNIVIKHPPLCKDNDSEQYKEICPTITSLYQEEDGTNFLAQRWKDKGSHGWETETGYTFVRDLQDYWMYAIHDAKGNLIPSNNIVGKDLPPAGVKPHLRPIKPFLPKVTNPIFQDSMLILPFVDLPERGGAYQNVMFELTDEGEWKLLDFLITQELQHIDKVEIIKTDSFPVQVFLKVTGNFTSGCQEMGQISSKLLGKKFDIRMYSASDKKLSTNEFVCTESLSSFTHIISLPVYSLKKGEYEYSVNGRHTSKFDLEKDNKL